MIRSCPNVCVAIAAATALLFVATGNGALAGNEARGFGKANAQRFALRPTTGALSLGRTIGETAAPHANHRSASPTRAEHLGVLGGALAAEGCDGGALFPADLQPQPLIADSNRPEARSGVAREEAAVSLTTRAADEPQSIASATLQGFELPGTPTGCRW
jgi:hypothetical protein